MVVPFLSVIVMVQPPSVAVTVAVGLKPSTPSWPSAPSKSPRSAAAVRVSRAVPARGGGYRRSVGQRGRSVRSRGGVGRDLGRVLVGVDGVHEQREPVLVPLAADDHGLHAYRENPRADIGVVPARHHHLRQHRALGFLHRGRVVDFERAGSSVDSGEQLRSALAGNLVPPHEVDGCPAEVGSSAVLPDGKRNPTPAGVGRRGNQHVAEPLVRSVPNQPVKSVSVEHEAPPRVSAQGMPASQPRRQKSRSASSSRSSMASVTVLSTTCTEVATLRLPSMPATSFCSAATSAASELVTA